MPNFQATAAQNAASQSVSYPAQKNSPILYGLGSFGLESAYKVFWGFYLFYYVDVLGLAVTLAAMINVVYGIWDALNDPLFGFLSDNTRTRWGRRRPWLLEGLPFYVAFLVLTYAVPGPLREGLPLFWYALAMVMLFGGVDQGPGRGDTAPLDLLAAERPAVGAEPAAGGCHFAEIGAGVE